MSSDPQLNATVPNSDRASEPSSHSMDKPIAQTYDKSADFGGNTQVSEADNLMSKSDPDTVQFMAQRNEMLLNQNAEPGAEENKVQLNPIGPLAASSTVVNLLLATGPFS